TAQRRDDRAVALAFPALGDPFRVALEGVPLLLPLGERFPLQQVVKILVRFADQDGPEAGLANAVLLPQAERDGVEALEERRQATRQAVIDAKLVDHFCPLSA